mmetsp:Transcript_21175/g.38662  ORF Transcript_21175/g.38662 Transcript_21175/m.38662 type:complete len:131 (-) Transcript_21175:157-549(-)
MMPSRQRIHPEVNNLNTIAADTRPCSTTSRWCKHVSYIASSYFLLVVMCRCVLRSARAQSFHWLLVAALEDGMSLLSFILGLLYLHYSEGSALSILLRKSIAADDSRTEGSAAASAREARRPIRLFYFAM